MGERDEEVKFRDSLTFRQSQQDQSTGASLSE